jgi:hypothetical protein
VTPKLKSVLLQILLAGALLGAGSLLALFGVRPPCCDPVTGHYTDCPPESQLQNGGRAVAAETDKAR